jgi:hypothetical protein
MPSPLAGARAEKGRLGRCAGGLVPARLAGQSCVQHTMAGLLGCGDPPRLPSCAPSEARPILPRNAERAFRCSVCRALFSVPPPQPRSAALAAQALRGIGGALCITLLAFGLSGGPSLLAVSAMCGSALPFECFLFDQLSVVGTGKRAGPVLRPVLPTLSAGCRYTAPAGPPWPHLALLVLLLLASRSHWLPGMALLLVCGGLAAMHARGLRLVLRLDGGGRVGLALIRRGAPVPGIRPGEGGLCACLFVRCGCLFFFFLWCCGMCRCGLSEKRLHSGQGAQLSRLTPSSCAPPAGGTPLQSQPARAAQPRGPAMSPPPLRGHGRYRLPVCPPPRLTVRRRRRSPPSCRRAAGGCRGAGPLDVPAQRGAAHAAWQVREFARRRHAELGPLSACLPAGVIALC